MIRRALLAVSVCSLLASACGSSAPPPSEPPSAPPAMAPAAPQPSPAVAPAPPPEPSAEEKKKAADAKELAEDRAKWQAESKAEAARWTPELHAEAKALAGKTYPTTKAALDTVLKGKHREPGNPERDVYRHPADTLTFLGFKPTMTVLEYGPGEGWWTEILAPALAQKGKLIVTASDPSGPPDARPTFYGQRWKAFVEKSPELYGKVEPIVVDGKNPDLAIQGKVDMALVFRAMHGMHNNKMLGTWLAEIHEALKPNGVLGVEQHRAKADANPDESAKKGYLPEAWVIEQVEKAGFKLAGKSEINANPKDTKDYPEGVWSLPPTLREKDKNRDKYVAIGESDRMTLKFTKVAAPAAKDAAPKKDAAPAKDPAPKKDAAPAKDPAPKKDAAPAKDPAPKKN